MNEESKRYEDLIYERLQQLHVPGAEWRGGRTGNSRINMMSTSILTHPRKQLHILSFMMSIG